MIFRRDSKAQASEESSGTRLPNAPAIRPVLADYVGQRFVDRNRRKLLWIFGGVILFYGMAFGVLSSFLLPPLIAPLAIMALMVIWLLPDSEHNPSETMASFLFAYLIALLVWPDYLALQIPGLPWISAIRLVGIPMVVMLVICLSVSKRFRDELKGVMEAVPILWKSVAIFAVIGLISVGFSHDIGSSISKLIVAILYWFSMFFIALHVFRVPGRIEKMMLYLWVILIFDCGIALWEGYLHAVPWAGHIPSLLQVQDPVILRILANHARAASGVYRIQGKFTTMLGLAELIGMTAPIVVYQLFNAKHWTLKLASFLSLPIIFMTVLGTDSRLAMISFGLSFFIYLLVWSLQHWRKRKDSIAGPALILTYPFLAAALIVASFTVTRVHNAVWGDGAAQASTEARQLQMQMGLPKVISHPWGHGIGMGAQTLGYADQSGLLTIDSYFLSLGLEYGVIGFAVFMTMFLSAMVYAALALAFSKDEEMQYMAPLSISLANFLISKSILSQQDNHSLAFILLGAVGAMYYRYKKEGKNPVVAIPNPANP